MALGSRTVNRTCPACGAPFYAAGGVYRGAVRFHDGYCIADWYAKHDRRSKVMRVEVERRKTKKEAFALFR